MIQRPKRFSDYQNQMLGALASTGITQLSPGGKARAIMDICSNELSELDVRKFSDLANKLAVSATGEALDSIGDIHGIRRIEQQDARVTPYDNNLKFYVRSGTFGSINNGQPIVIPENIQVTTSGAGGPVFLTDEAILDPEDNVQYVSARSYLPGSFGNVPERMLTVHNFRNYSDASSGSLLVVNDQGIIGGRDREDDENYRYRIMLKIRGSNGVNESALRLKLITLPGVQDVVFVRYSGGCIAYLYGISPIVSTEVLLSAQRHLSESIAFPLAGTVVAPDLVGISLSATIRVRPSTTTADRAAIVSQAQSAAAQYINNLRVGETLVVNTIATRIRNADQRILDVGRPNNPIGEIFVWRSRNDGTRYSRYLVNDYEPATGERLVVETSIPTPINIQAVSE